MREAAFVEQNKKKWSEFENTLKNYSNISPEELSNLYIELSDDLSYTQTFYPNSPTLIYLNQLVVQSHQLIYKSKKVSKNKIIHFYTTDCPLLFYKYRKQLFLSFCTFLFFVLVGVFSTHKEDSFTRAILGDAYVNMTLDNIDKGDPMAVYKEQGSLNMFLGITINNIRVALLAFVYGLLFGVGTLYVLMKNGIMLGSFQYFFYDQGLLWESARTIWIHGTFEISVIIIAGGAGLVMGNSLLFTGTYTRLTSFLRGVKDGLKIVLSTLPFFIIAGFLEGFVTRQTQMPDFLALLIIGLSLFIVIYYYIIYPQKKFKTHIYSLTNL